MFTTNRLRTLLAASLIAAAVPAGLAVAHGNDTGGLTRGQRTAIRDATRQFRDAETATAAGYELSGACAEIPGVAGMGYHFVNPDLVADGRVVPTRPEVLVYNKTADGGFRLDAIEYFVVDADQNTATDDDRPTLMGHPFDGPMAGHELGMPVHYDLHAWVYRSNPAGDLSAWNPTITCN